MKSAMSRSPIIDRIIALDDAPAHRCHPYRDLAELRFDSGTYIQWTGHEWREAGGFFWDERWRYLGRDDDRTYIGHFLGYPCFLDPHQTEGIRFLYPESVYVDGSHAPLR